MVAAEVFWPALLLVPHSIAQDSVSLRVQIHALCLVLPVYLQSLVSTNAVLSRKPFPWEPFQRSSLSGQFEGP